MNDWLSQPRGHLHKRQQPSCHNLHVQLGLYTLLFTWPPPFTALYSSIYLSTQIDLHTFPRCLFTEIQNNGSVETENENLLLQHTISSCAVASPQYTAVLPEYTFKGLHFSPKTS